MSSTRGHNRDSKEKSTMRSKTTILAALAVAALLAALVPVAFAQPPGGSHGMHSRGHDRGRDLTEFLGLSDEQREAWRQAQKSHFEGLRPTFEKIRDLREQLKAEIESSSPDAATVGGYVISIHQLDADIAAARGDLDSALNEILTDEQETKFEAWKAANPGPRPGFGSPGAGRHGPRPDHPPGGSGDDAPDSESGS
jgi:Spy/CpxP family protein refolding chaperone